MDIFLALSVRQLIGQPQIQQRFSVSLAIMETGTGREGKQAHMLLTYKLTHIDLETTRTEANVPTEQGTTSQGETSAGQHGKEGHTSFSHLSICLS